MEFSKTKSQQPRWLSLMIQRSLTSQLNLNIDSSINHMKPVVCLFVIINLVRTNFLIEMRRDFHH